MYPYGSLLHTTYRHAQSIASKTITSFNDQWSGMREETSTAPREQTYVALKEQNVFLSTSQTNCSKRGEFLVKIKEKYHFISFQNYHGHTSSACISPKRSGVVEFLGELGGCRRGDAADFCQCHMQMRAHSGKAPAMHLTQGRLPCVLCIALAFPTSPVVPRETSTPWYIKSEAVQQADQRGFNRLGGSPFPLSSLLAFLDESWKTAHGFGHGRLVLCLSLSILFT